MIKKLIQEKIYELAEVVKDLNKNTDIIADQSYSERQLFEKAYERLKSNLRLFSRLALKEYKDGQSFGQRKISEEIQKNALLKL